jgi:hypothetical protein
MIPELKLQTSLEETPGEEGAAPEKNSAGI